MATETPNTSAPPPAVADKKPQPPQQKTDDAPKKESKEASGEKKLTGAELKAKAKAEKAARRAKAKEAQPAPPQGQGAQQGAGAADTKGGKSKQRQDGTQGAGGPPAKGGPAAKVVPVAPKEVKPKVPECFSHLSMAKRIHMTEADKDVHSAVLALGQQMSAFAISDSTTRLEATLLAFKKVIDSYTTPPGNTFSRHFTSHVLNPQIEYLSACRPMCFSMGNAVRWLKLQVSKIDIDLPDFDAKKLLCESVDNFIRERITLADFVIVNTAADSIEDGEVVLTYAHHPLVERALRQAHADGKKFSVTVVDDPFENTGRELAKQLRALPGGGIEVVYCPDLSAMRAHLRGTSRVLVGAEAMFSNGAMYARAGTSDIAIAAADQGIRVVALSETINFTERVAMDSLTYNEVDPEQNTEEGFRLLFDTTRDHHISVVITELGITSPVSVPAILRKLEEL
ncbi:putative translation initiation factor eIF-2B subunit delta [Colletotrichum orbiculare MAFF 240422]|uniref:Translation initiation factor eIF2B subunit delta n=1 Tax=Colletotrichum orbiculare (strain 104-T / ATCC 96160 / CBS 514.97 / LARS 414 / MAFF 240422) TaxID=1213857 RepID=N4V5S1_COLOR|nr:putative translation initiation factor eIF-2B subunit delta [Colletotrichum orbiculare MAFF 240422]